MKITKIEDLRKFEEAINKCKNDVWLESIHGDHYNLKSELCKYVAFGEMIANKMNDLELFCSNPAEEAYFFDFIANLS